METSAHSKHKIYWFAGFLWECYRVGISGLLCAWMMESGRATGKKVSFPSLVCRLLDQQNETRTVDNSSLPIIRLLLLSYVNQLHWYYISVWKNPILWNIMFCRVNKVYVLFMMCSLYICCLCVRVCVCVRMKLCEIYISLLDKLLLCIKYFFCRWL